MNFVFDNERLNKLKKRMTRENVKQKIQTNNSTTPFNP